MPNYFFKHLKKEKVIDRIFRQIDKIECPLCSASTDVFLFHRHMQNNHRDVSENNPQFVNVVSQYTGCNAFDAVDLLLLIIMLHFDVVIDCYGI